MSLPELCIRRPVMTTLLMLSFIVFGIFGYFKLPISALPRVDFPTISVSTQLPGANPETMATSVVAPLERAFATIPGISLMTSRSTNGGSNITMQFDLDPAPPAARTARAPQLPQGQSCGRAGAFAGAVIPHHAAFDHQ